MPLLFDRNGVGVWFPDEDGPERDALMERVSHRGPFTETQPAPEARNLGGSIPAVRARKVRNRVAALQRRWQTRKTRAISDAMAAGKPEAEAIKAAHEEFGENPPTEEALAAEIMASPGFPEYLKPAEA